MQISVEVSTIILVCLGVLGTHFLLPFVLVLRDVLLWKAIDRHVLTDELVAAISRHSQNVADYNRLFDGSIGDSEDLVRDAAALRRMGEELKEDGKLIASKNFWLKALLKHYKQDAHNPIAIANRKAIEKSRQRQ